MAFSRWATAVAAVSALTAAGCSSGRRPPVPFPADPDKCAAYCLEYLPPTYRDVPALVQCKPSAVCPERTWRRDIRFAEVCKPGCYEQKCIPAKCQRTVELQVTPGRTEWVPTDCPCDECCWRPVDVPPCTKACPVTVTEKGVSYCAFTPPEYDIVRRDRLVCVDRPVYRPAEYKVCWKKELFMPGQWAWKKRADCVDPCSCCPPVAPSAAAMRPGFNIAPPAD